MMGPLPPDDRGFTLGDGLFETVLAEAGVLVRLPAHLARLAAGCEALGLPAPDPAEAEGLLREALTHAGLTDTRAAARLTLTAGSGGRGLDRPAAPVIRLVATAAAARRPADPARLATSAVRRNDASPASRLKTLSYLDNVLARAQAREAGADEALMLNTTGEMACAAAANVFWIEGGRLFTPALDCGALAGVTRAEVLAAAARLGISTHQTRATPEVLANAEAVFLTNALVGVRPVVELDGRGFAPHALSAALAAAIS